MEFDQFDREIRIRLTRIEKAIESCCVQNRGKYFRHGSKAREREEKKMDKIRTAAIQKIIYDETNYPIENSGMMLSGKLRTTNVDLFEYFIDIFEN